jgi:hypothetical protein
VTDVCDHLLVDVQHQRPQGKPRRLLDNFGHDIRVLFIFPILHMLAVAGALVEGTVNL